jgi:hypothetical protein
VVSVTVSPRHYVQLQQVEGSNPGVNTFTGPLESLELGPVTIRGNVGASVWITRVPPNSHAPAGMTVSAAWEGRYCLGHSGLTGT